MMATGALERMDGKTTAEIVGAIVGSSLGITTIYNTIALRRDTLRQRAAAIQKQMDVDAVLATKNTIEQLTEENARVWHRLSKMDADFEQFKVNAAKRDEEHRSEMVASRAQIERNRGDMFFLRRETMALFQRIATWIGKEQPGSSLGLSIASEMSAFVASVDERLGPMGDAPNMIGDEGRKQGE